MSIKGKVSGLLGMSDVKAEGEYSPEELATVAEDILGYDEVRWNYRLGPTAIYTQKEVYTVLEEAKGVKVNSNVREKPYEALEEAKKLLENNEVEVIK